MKILVIGNGFVAGPICEVLKVEGHEILIYSRTASKKIQSQQVEGDIFDFTDFAKVFAWRPNVVIHTAWITTPGVYKSDPSNFKYAEFTISLANLIAHSDVEHLIVLGTCAEYGQQTGPSTAGITKTAPKNLYSEQKVAAFRAVENTFKDSTTRLTWARLFFPFGPYQHEKRLIPLLINSLRGEAPIQLADVSSVYDWITTRDIASAISWVIGHELPTEIDIGTSIGFTNFELLTILEKLLQIKHLVKPHLAHKMGANEFFVMGKDSPLLTSGWLPIDTLESGLKWTLEQ
jgi:UDP-glucuronate decarboxylase